MVDTEDGTVRLQFTCGGIPCVGFVNFDTMPAILGTVWWMPGTQFPMPADASRRFPDASVDYIALPDFLQTIPHHPQEEPWWQFWAECWRVLKLGGTVEAVTPFGATPRVWSNPANCRVVTPESFRYLSPMAREQLGLYGWWLAQISFDFFSQPFVEYMTYPDSLRTVLTKIPLSESEQPATDLSELQSNHSEALAINAWSEMSRTEENHGNGEAQYDQTQTDTEPGGAARPPASGTDAEPTPTAGNATSRSAAHPGHHRRSKKSRKH